MTDILSEAQLARGRGRAYALLAELISRGPTRETLEAARASDALDRALSSYANLDEAAADHQHVFGFSVPPYEGVFLHEKGQVGGPITDDLSERFRAMGFVHDARGDGVEHLSTQLRALAFVSVAEADALERTDDEAEAAVPVIRGHARDLLDAHVLRYFAPFAAAVRACERPLPGSIIEVLTDVITLHRGALGAATALPPAQLEGAPLDLDDDDTDVRQIAAALATAARVGLFISRDDVARLGRSQRVPRGFGERRTLIHNLLRTSVGLGALPAVLDELRALVRSRCDDLGDPRYRDIPGIANLLAPWRMQLETTDATLIRLAEASREQGARPAAQTAQVP